MISFHVIKPVKRILYFSFLLFILIPLGVFPQDEPGKKFTFDGYISNMQSIISDSLKGNWIADNLFHNRLNMNWFPSNNITFSVQMRNRLMYGETVKYSPDYADGVDNDDGFMDLSMNIFNEQSFFLNSSIDRIYVQITKGKLVTTIGRQRVNWGISSVWNPNDIFNVQNYFDFDYIEKPGSDAIRLQYYTGASSSVEIAAKLDRDKRFTTAALYRFNTGGYDFQFMGGILQENDYVAGLGWSGDIKNVGFKGEFSYFHPMKNARDTAGIFHLSLGGDYMFNNSLFLQLEALFSKMPPGTSISDFLSWYMGTLTVKNLSFTELSLFGSLSYPISPLLNGNIAIMYFPDLQGFFAGPGIDFSLSDNMQFSLILQVFSADLPDPITLEIKRNSLFLGFIRYKLSF